MILLKRGEIGTMLVTVEERSYGYSNYYRFVFQHGLTKEVISVVLKVQGLIPNRADFFHIDVDAVFGASDDGFYSYEVFTYGVDQEHPFPNPKLIEKGRMRLIGTHAGPVLYEGSPKKYITYGR